MPVGQELPTDIRMPESLTFRDANSRDVFTALGKIGSVNVIFDPQFSARPVSIDLKNPSFEEALQAVSTATRNFYRVTAQRTVTVIPDTAAKRQEYEEEIVRPFFLSNADLKETMDLLRVVIDARRVAPVTATNAIMIKDTPERVAAAGKIIAAIDKARPEVVIDVELLEVDRTRLREFGLQIASPGDPPTGINGSGQHQPRRFVAARSEQPARRPTSSSPTCRTCTTGCSRTTRTRAPSPTRSCGRPKGCPRRRVSASAFPCR